MACRFESCSRSLALMGLAVLAFLTSITPVAAQPSTPQGSIVELQGVPWRLNDNGEIAGWVYVGDNAHPAIYREGAWHDLGVPAGDQLGALFGINNHGATVGYSYFTNYLPSPNTPQVVDNRWRAIWAPEGAASIQLLSGLTPDSFAYAINDSGTIVGCRNRDDDFYPDPHRAFVHDAGGVTDLHGALIASVRPADPTPNELDYSCAADINSAGDIVGYVIPSYGLMNGFLYRGGEVSLLAHDFSTYLVNARALNASGMVVGEGLMPGFTALHAVAYRVDTEAIVSLGAESKGAASSVPSDVNDLGEVVGSMTFGTYPNTVDRAFFWSNGQLFDLNDLVPAGGDWVLQFAHSINNQSQVVGRGYRTSSPGVTRYFLLGVTLTPEQRTTSLIKAVQDLVAAGVLGSGNGNALTIKLEGALQQVEKGNVGAAVNQIQAFINQVQEFVQSGKLTAAQGQSLVDGANAIVTTLTS